MTAEFSKRARAASIGPVRPLRFVLIPVVMVLVTACSQPATIAAGGGEDWTGPDGEPVAGGLLALYAVDCEAWPGAGFLDIAYPLDASDPQELRRYARDPERVLPTVELLAPYDPNGSLPRGARFSGYQTDRFMLFVGEDSDVYVYLVDGPRVEALPRAEDSLTCP